MLIDTNEYINHLKEEVPEFNFTSLEKIEDYREDCEIYEVVFTKDEREFRYSMIAGMLGFTEEQFKQNFVSVARNTYKAALKEEQ